MVGKAIRRLRVARGLTQETVAKRARIARVTLVRIEGGTQDPTVGVVERIAHALGVSVRALFPEQQQRRGRQ